MKVSSDSSNSSKGEGNTSPPPSKVKQISPSKRWCFTVFKLEESDISCLIKELDSSNSSYILGDEICPDTKHIELGIRSPTLV